MRLLTYSLLILFVSLHSAIPSQAHFNSYRSNKPLVISQIITGRNHTCMLTQHRVKCWGDNSYGQSDVPVGLKNPTQITAGWGHTCALTHEGVKCWGDNDFKGYSGFFVGSRA